MGDYGDPVSPAVQSGVRATVKAMVPPVVGASYNDLSSIVAAACFDLDATIEDSYSGSGDDFKNLVPSPADGAGQTEYDFARAAGAAGPVFTGTAGSSDASRNVDPESSVITLRHAIRADSSAPQTERYSTMKP